MNLADLGGLLFRQDFGDHFVESDLLSDPVGDLLIVACQHDALNAHGLQRRNGLRGLLTDDVGKRDRAGELVVDQHEHDGLAFGAQGLEAGIVHLNPLIAQIAGANDLDVAVLDCAFSALAGDRLELVDRPRIRRVIDDALGDRMLGVGFDRGGVDDNVLFAERGIEHERVGDSKRALGQGSRLVENNRIDLACVLKRGPIPDE